MRKIISARVALFVYLLAIIAISAIAYGPDVEWDKQDKAVLIGLVTFNTVMLAINIYHWLRPTTVKPDRGDGYAYSAVIYRKYGN